MRIRIHNLTIDRYKGSYKNELKTNYHVQLYNTLIQLCIVYFVELVKDSKTVYVNTNVYIIQLFEKGIV